MLDRLTRRLKLAVLLSLLFSAFATTCADAQNADGWGLEQLMTQLGRVQRSGQRGDQAPRTPTGFELAVRVPLERHRATVRRDYDGHPFAHVEADINRR